MQLITKYFNEMTTSELYEILKVRAKIFVVEQNCVYQDLDDIDYKCLHIYYENEGKILAYMRAFKKSDMPLTYQLGRVLTTTHGIGLGAKLLKQGISYIRKTINPSVFYIEAQCYAISFYEREGFHISSEEFLEDGFPHVQMLLTF